MDPSIMKLLEEDEDESNYSGADVEAFTAALNRDIGGNVSISQTAVCDIGVLPGNSHPTSNQFFGQLDTGTQDENNSHLFQVKEEDQQVLSQEQESSKLDAIQHESLSGSQNEQDMILHHEQPQDDGQQQLLLHQQHLRDDQHEKSIEQTVHQFPQKGHVQTTEQNAFQRPEQEMFQHADRRPQYSKLPQLNRQAQATDQANNPMRLNIPFASLIPALRPHLDKDRTMQLHAIYTKLRNNEVNKDNFLRVMRNIVGDQMLRMAAHKVQMQAQAEAAQSLPTGSPLYQLQHQGSGQQHLMPSCSTQKFSDTSSFSQHHGLSSIQHQKNYGSYTHLSQISTSATHIQKDMGLPTPENSAQKSKQTESGAQILHVSQPLSTSIKIENQEKDLSMVSQQAYKQQQQQMHLPPTSFSMYGGAMNNHTNAQAYSGPSGGTAATNIKTSNQEARLRQGPHLQGLVSTQMGVSQPLGPLNEANRLHGGPPSHVLAQNPSSFGSVRNNLGIPAPAPIKDEPVENQSCRMGLTASTNMISTNSISGSSIDSSVQVWPQLPPAATPTGAGSNTRTPPKKPSTGQKKPIEMHAPTSPISNKKQKVSGALQDQSIEHLNDVTAVSGVNLREEEEQLLSAPKEESRASEATRRAVQEEEERLILEKGPLQKKITDIMSKCGMIGTSNEVDRCLSMCVEERLRGLISNLIRLSKQRVDIERSRHQILITSDVRRQILLMNQKAKEDWERKQAEEAEKLQKQIEIEVNGVDLDNEKDEGRSRAPKVNKEEDDKMRTTAANVAARAAVGGDDLLSKWHLMAEQARQKREGGQDGTFGALLGKDLKGRPVSASGRAMNDYEEAENRGPTSTSGSMRKFGQNQSGMSQAKVLRNITIQDVIAALEREPQMSKSTLIYNLYERVHTDSVAE